VNSSIRSAVHALLKLASLKPAVISLDDLSSQQIGWALDSGLGPLMHHLAESIPAFKDSVHWPLIQGTALAARILSEDHLETMAKIIDAFQSRQRTLTLLKGISFCELYYPRPYLRPMNDIDFLVEEADVPFAESVLLELGFRQEPRYPSHHKSSPEFFRKHHHTMPFCHAVNGVWVEVHRGLFSGQSPMSSERCFVPESVMKERQSAKFQGRNTSRLSDELQVLHTAAHWAEEFKVMGGVIGLLDMIFLLGYGMDTLNWDRVFSWTPQTSTSLRLCLVLTYLEQNDLVDFSPEVSRELSKQVQKTIGKMKLKLLVRMIDRYLVDEKGARLQEFQLRTLSEFWRSLLQPTSLPRNFMSFPRYLLPSCLWVKFRIQRFMNPSS
jgi:Uncharacterised nucleotidyltransferase